MPLVCALRKEGYRVHLLTQYDDYLSRIEGEFDGVYELSLDRSGTNPIRDLFSLLNIIKYLLVVRPDILLTYTIKPVIYGGLIARVMGVPVIATITGLGAVFITENWKTTLVRKLYSSALCRSWCVFFLNTDDRELFIKDKMVRTNIANLLPGEGINLGYFTGAAENDKIDNIQSSFRFLLIGRMLWDKGVGEYVEAAKLIKQSYPTVEFCLLGFMNVQNPAAISRKHMDVWVSEGVVNYLGVSDDVREQIAAADCVVLPSYREGTPRTLMEASAMGRPIIASDAVGCREVVDNGISGFLCKPRDADDLAEKMEKIMGLSSKERSLMGKNGRAKMEKEFDEQIVIKRYLHEVKEVVNFHKSQDARLVRWIFWLACLVVTTFSLTPVEPLPVLASSFSFGDKALHAVAFAGLCLIGSWAYLNRTYSLILGLLVLGGGIELAQFATGWRYMQFGDLVANAVGIMIGRIAFHSIQKREPNCN